MSVKISSFFSFFLLLTSLQSFAETEVEFELDPYYSNIGLYVPFNNEKIPTVSLKNERAIYNELFKKAFTPSFIVFEFSANPLPILGVYLKKHQAGLYKNAQLSNNVNLIEALTEGFEEPYAFSLFLGNVIKFTLPNETKIKTVNKGYSGLLFNIGNKHIRSNQLFDDNWLEVEFKLKGDRRIGDLYHSFSFRMGTKRHQNKNIDSSYYFGIRREFYNSEVKDYDLLENIGVDFRVDYSTQTKDLIQAQLFIDKRWPTKNAEVSFAIGLKRVNGKYLNELSDLNQDLQLILRPSIRF